MFSRRRSLCVVLTWLAAAPKSCPAGQPPVDAAGRPLIRKVGTIDLDIVETTPVVWRGKLWRFEWVRPGTPQQFQRNRNQPGHFRFRDAQSGEMSPPFAREHEYGSAFVEHDAAYVTGPSGRSRLNLFASRDLKTWEQRTVIDDARYGIFNTSMCKADGEYVLAFEIDRPAEETGVCFTIRFAKSRDLRKWTITPPECNFTKERYSAAPCLRWNGGWFYLFYLEAHDGYETHVVRSRDLVQWETSPLNPVLRASADDKRIANPALTAAEREWTTRASNLNASDLDFCEYRGHVVFNYSWGDQAGVEFLAEAAYDGTEKQFLRGWFPKLPKFRK